MQWTLVVPLLAMALVVNVPLGMWRRGLRRFSLGWFLAIHASIPLLVAMRFALGLGSWIIPPEIVLAIVGQWLGSRLPAPWRRAYE